MQRASSSSSPSGDSPRKRATDDSARTATLVPLTPVPLFFSSGILCLVYPLTCAGVCPHKPGTRLHAASYPPGGGFSYEQVPTWHDGENGGGGASINTKRRALCAECEHERVERERGELAFFVF